MHLRVLIYFFLMMLLSCNKPMESSDIGSTSKDLSSLEPVTYEGKIPLDDETQLSIAVTLRSGTMNGEGQYILEETSEAPLEQTTYDALEGNYSITQAEDRTLIHLHNSIRMDNITRTFFNEKTKKINEEKLRAKDLSFIKMDNALIVLDTRMEPVTNDYNQNLIERSSRVFTVEGYFKYKGDTSEFFEMNTNEHLPLSKRGAYTQTARQYHLLANKKFESIYLKGTGYLVKQRNAQGKFIDMLVLKKIIQMNASGGE